MGPFAEKEEDMRQGRAGMVKKNSGYGNKLGYSIFQFVLRNIGLNWAYGLLIFLVPYYVLLRPSVYRLAKPYLMRRFPKDYFFMRLFRLFKYIYVFGQALLDQIYFGFAGDHHIKLVFDREAEILELLNNRPVIFLMSHVGYWEIAMAGSMRFNKKMNILVNQDFDKDKRNSFYDIRESQFSLINVTDKYGGMIEATNALLRGEVLGVAGDRAEKWRSRSACFLGSPARFPVVAQQLAVATGASVIALFTFKEGKNTIRFHWKDISTDILFDPIMNKEEKIESMLDVYTKELEQHVSDHPYLWFNFFDFWQV